MCMATTILLSAMIISLNGWRSIQSEKTWTALTIATFLYELLCHRVCFKVQINDQGRELVNETSLISYTFWQTIEDN